MTTTKKQLRFNRSIDLQLGDTVYLNSGGPAMTVAVVDGDSVHATWKGKKIYHTAKFRRDCLSIDVPAATTGQ